VSVVFQPLLKMERRSARRYPVVAIAHYRWKTTVFPFENGEGRTQDISTNGVFVVSDARLPSLDAHVCIALFHDRANEPRIWLHGEGVVVRVDSVEHPDRGFAVALRTILI
jgi:hypothetical protein